MQATEAQVMRRGQRVGEVAPRSPDLGLGWLHFVLSQGLLTLQAPLKQGRGNRLTRFSLDESFTLTPQATSGLGKVSDQPCCVQFRNMLPVGVKHPARE